MVTEFLRHSQMSWDPTPSLPSLPPPENRPLRGVCQRATRENKPPLRKKRLIKARTLNDISTKREKTRCAMCTRDLSLLGRVLRYERDTGEVSCEVFFLVCLSVCLKKKSNFLIPFWGGG